MPQARQVRRRETRRPVNQGAAKRTHLRMPATLRCRRQRSRHVHTVRALWSRQPPHVRALPQVQEPQPSEAQQGRGRPGLLPPAGHQNLPVRGHPSTGDTLAAQEEVPQRQRGQRGGRVDPQQTHGYR